MGHVGKVSTIVGLGHKQFLRWALCATSGTSMAQWTLGLVEFSYIVAA